MFYDDVPEFRKVKLPIVTTYINRILNSGGGLSLLKLVEFEDNHYRAIFRASYFALADEETEPSKSQWNTLKKKMKRHDRTVFVFREYGKVNCAELGDSSARNIEEDCLYIDFGFMD